MPVPAESPVAVPALEPTAVKRYLPEALAILGSWADPALDLLCSSTVGLRLAPETATAPGLNPFHLALADLAVAAAALRGHILRAGAGDTSPQLQQAMVYDLLSWPMLQTDMLYNWDRYRHRVGEMLGTLPQWVEVWEQQMDQAHHRVLEAVGQAMGMEQVAALVPTIWSPLGMHRF